MPLNKETKKDKSYCLFMRIDDWRDEFYDTFISIWLLFID